MADIGILRAVWFALIVLQLFGTSPIWLRKIGEKVTYHVCPIGVLYIIFLMAVVCYASYVTYAKIGATSSGTDVFVMMLHFHLHAEGSPICSFLILLFSLFSSKTICRAMVLMSEISTAFPKYFTPNRYKAIMAFSMILFLILLSVCLYICLDKSIFRNLVSSDTNLSFVESVAFFIAWMAFDFLSWGTIIQLLVVTCLLFSAFRALEIEIDKALKNFTTSRSILSTIQIAPKVHFSGKTMVAAELQSLRIQYMNLTVLAGQINAVFSSRILVIIAFDTVLLCFSCFEIITAVGSKSVWKKAMANVCVRLLPSVFIILPFCLVKKKEEEICTHIHTWATKPIEGDPDTQNELYRFATQMHHRRLRFSAHSFFPLEPSTLLSVAGAGISYLIVLIQLELGLQSINFNVVDEKKGTAA